MVKILKILILFLFSYTAYGQCPIRGDGAMRLWHIDSLKNIKSCPDTSEAYQADFNTLATDYIMDSMFVFLDCFIVSAKLSGIESCECHDSSPAMRDYHIYVSDKPKNTNNKCVIVEVTRFSRQFNPSLTLAYVKSLVGKKVRVYGYVFSDEEHKNAIGKWRQGIEEIHPVFYIEKL